MKEVLGASSGTVVMSLSNEAVPAFEQLLMVCFSELASPSDAAWLATASANEIPGRAATVAFSTENILCVAVSASTVAGKAAAETASSLQRLVDPVKEFLSRPR